MPRQIDLDRPFETFDRRELLAWNAQCGRLARGAKWQFLATLPEIARIEGFRDAGFRSLHELAARRGAVSERDVDDTLFLHGRIGQFWVLWCLFASGVVGLSKLLLISRHVTAENADWWAEQVQRCNRAQLRDLVEALEREARRQGAAPIQTEPLFPDAPEAMRGRSACADKLGKTGEPPPAAAPASVAAEVSRQAEVCSRPARVWVTAELSAAGAKALDDLQARYEREHGPISRGELIERLALDTLDRGAVVAGEEGAGAPPAKPVASRRLLEIVYRDADRDARWLPSRFGPIPMTEVPVPLQDRLAGCPSITLEELRARAQAASARHERSLARRLAARKQAGLEIPEDFGREVPAAIEIFLMGRSGGLCESEDCSERVVDFHHVDPFSETCRHDIDRMLAVCKDHHDSYHGDLLAPDQGDPRILRPVQPGTPIVVGVVNARVATAKRRAVGDRERAV